MRLVITALTAALMAVALAASAHSQDQAASSSASGPAYTPADEAAGHAGDIAAIRRTMQHYLDAKDARTAALWARLGADKDDTACQVALARLLAAGDLGAPDLVHAYMWADLAAAKHDPDLGPDAESIRDDVRHRMDVDQVMDAKAAEGKWRSTRKH